MDTNPTTIEELKEYCAKNRIPIKKMRFYIGEDNREAESFGIFREADGNSVVYKNKSDGTRAIRYRGDDESYAVSEIYKKLMEEYEEYSKTSPGHSIFASKSAKTDKQISSRPNRKGMQQEAKWYQKVLGILLIGVIAFFIWEPTLFFALLPIGLIPYGIYNIVKKSWTTKVIIIWASITIVLASIEGVVIYNIVQMIKFN